MIKMGERKSSVSKRLLEVEADEDEIIMGSPMKRACVSAFSKKLQDLSSQRQEANGSI